jgi:predicted regulator of Ras-like GTPase activity (Roadblock/LC7/MglB family)
MKTGAISRQGYQMRSGLRIFPSHEQAFDRILTELVQRLPAHFVLLTDVAGQIVVSKGDHEKINLVALGSLMAGDLAASQEIARLTGEYQDYQIILREGQSSHTLISEASNYLALLVQITNDVPLGWARMCVQKACRDLALKLAESDHLGIEEAPLEIMTESDADLSDLFSQALDDLWQE